MDKTNKPTYRADADALAALPEHVRSHKYFCLWKWHFDNHRDAWTKVPYDPRTGRMARSNDPETFAPFGVAMDAYAKGGFDGVGIGLFDGLSAIDVDHHLDAERRPDGFAASIIEAMDAYTEVSPSGDGIHILFRCASFAAEIDRAVYMKRWYINKRDLGLESYICGITQRFMTITGDAVKGGSVGDKSEQLNQVLDAHMLREPKGHDSSDGAAEPRRVVHVDHSLRGGNLSPDDSQLVDKATNAAKTGPTFAALWAGDASGYKSHSEADQALCNMLAFWTNKDAERMDRLFRTSGLFRTKWEREDYRTATIAKAIEGTKNGYDPGSAAAITRVKRQMGTRVNPTTTRVVDEAILKTNMLDMEVNDLNLARAFAASFGHVVRYVADAGVFYTYDGKEGRWRPDGKQGVVASRYLKVFYDRLLALAASREADEGRASSAPQTFDPLDPSRRVSEKYDYVADVLRYASFAKRANVLADSKSEIVSHVADFDLDLDLLNVRNGTLDLRTMELRPHDPADMITKRADVEYNQSADPAEWRRFLAETLEGDADMMLYLQQQMGLSMAGDTTKEHMHLLYGPTRSGKSTCVNTVKAVMGDYACGISPATITKQKRSGQSASEDLARLAGVRMGVVPEPQKGMELSTEIIKSITGNDSITARKLYQGSRDLTLCVNLWVATNHLPQVDDPTVFESDRMVIVPFSRHLEKSERDTGLKKRLLSAGNRSAVLNWLIEGLRSYRENPVSAPEAADDATHTFRGQMDSVSVFMAEVPIAEDGATCTARQMFDAYKKWAESGNADPNKGFQEFNGNLRRIGVLRRYKGTRNVCVGYRLPECPQG